MHKPNLWHFSALSWGTSHLLLTLFSLPISFSQTGIRVQLCLSLAHLAGVTWLWRLGGRRGNPERLLNTALVTLVFIYLVPLCMLVTPLIVLAAYALPPPAWRTVAAMLLSAATALSLARIWTIAASKDTGRRFELFLFDELKDNVIHANSVSGLLSRIGRHAIEPTRIDSWSMCAAIAAGAPVLGANIALNSISTGLAICALIATPLAMHAFSRMAVHVYLWIYRLGRFERETGIKILANCRSTR